MMTLKVTGMTCDHCVRAVTTKKEVLALPGSAARAIDRIPLSCGVSLNSGARSWTKACWTSSRGSRRDGKYPPWMTNPRTTRWNAVPL